MNRPVDTSEATTRYVGRSIKRREDPKYLTGQSQYTDDLMPSGTLSVAIVRSLYAHARIVRINVEQARRHTDSGDSQQILALARGGVHLLSGQAER